MRNYERITSPAKDPEVRMPGSSDGVDVSAMGASRLAPPTLQNWASDEVSRPQLGESMVELPSPGSKLLTRVMIILV